MDIIALLGTILLVLYISIFIHSTWNSMYRKCNLPPGPIPCPVIGNLLSIKKGELVNSLMKLWKQYGPVYTLYFGSQPVIILCGYDAVKEALVDQAEEFGDRGTISSIERVAQGYGLSFSNGERWRQIRNFTLKSLRDLGMGRKSIEEKIQEEAQCLVEELRNSKETPVDPTKMIMDAVSNILCSILFGDCMEYSGERISKLLAILEDKSHFLSGPWGQLELIIPKLMALIPGPHQKNTTFTQELVSFTNERMKSNQGTLDPSFPRDLTDSFLIKMQQPVVMVIHLIELKQTQWWFGCSIHKEAISLLPPNVTIPVNIPFGCPHQSLLPSILSKVAVLEKENPDSEFTMKNSLMTIYSLFLGGIETVSTTLRHGILLMVKYPHIQARIHEEIDRVFGRQRASNMNDQIKMPYTEAVINEIQRFSDIAPLNIPHKVTKDTYFRGFTIPKDTEVFPLLCTVHRDPKYFSTPYKFNPDHFLDEQGRFKKNDAMMAFSAGKRSCPGESLTRMELFLFFTSILQNFTLTSLTHFTEDDVAPKLTGFINFPIEYKVSFVARQ
ncbi:cytochrome P450 2G1-like [Rhinophrynus dorsalis]